MQLIFLLLSIHLIGVIPSLHLPLIIKQKQ